MRIPYAFQGFFFAPALIALLLVLKAFCPDSAGDACFADHFAVPIFLPLIAIYKIFGQTSSSYAQEFLFIIFYWGLFGLLVGFILDLCTARGNESQMTNVQ